MLRINKILFLILIMFFCVVKVEAQETLADSINSDCWSRRSVSARNDADKLLDLGQAGFSTGDINNDGISDLALIGLQTTTPETRSRTRNSDIVFYTFSKENNDFESNIFSEYYDSGGKRRNNFISIYNDCWDERGAKRDACSFVPLVGGIMISRVGEYYPGDIELMTNYYRNSFARPVAFNPVDLFIKQGSDERLKLTEDGYIVGTKMIDRDGDGVYGESLIVFRGNNTIYGARIIEDNKSISADIPTFTYIGSQNGDNKLVSVNALNYGDFHGDGVKVLVGISREEVVAGKPINKINISSGGSSSHQLKGLEYDYPEQEDNEVLTYKGNELLGWGVQYGEYLDMTDSRSAYCKVDTPFDTSGITEERKISTRTYCQKANGKYVQSGSSGCVTPYAIAKCGDDGNWEGITASCGKYQICSGTRCVPAFTIKSWSIQEDPNYDIVAKKEIKYEVMQSAVAVGDINGDGKDDMVVVGGASKVQRQIYPKAFNLKTFDCSIGDGCRYAGYGNKTVSRNSNTECSSFVGFGTDFYLEQLAEKDEITPQWIPWKSKGLARVYMNKTKDTAADLVFDKIGDFESDYYIRDAIILDYNHDGLGDLITLSVNEQDFDKGYLYIYLSRGYGYFDDPIKYNVGQDLRTLLVDNLDGKGGDDFAFLNGNGLVEVRLNGCTSSVKNPPFKFGNANSDGFIDLVDFEIWREIAKDNKNVIDRADFNGNKKVDGFDLIIWKDSYFEYLKTLFGKNV